MKLMYSRLIALACFISLISSCAFADPDKKTEKPVTPAKSKGIEAPADSTGAAEIIIPEVNFQGQQLEEVIDFLQDTIPNFKAMVVRDTGVSPEVPTIRMRLKKVSLEQFIALLNIAYPE